MIRIPGKVFLCGEYAVLEGAPAVVAAVGRYGKAWLDPAARVHSSFVAEAMRAITEWLTDRGLSLPPGSPVIDTNAFRSDAGDKLGLGSSAVATVGAMAALADAAGLDLTEPSIRRDLTRFAVDAHRRAQGGTGSGADIAACVQGGFLRYSRAEAEWPLVEPLQLPRGLVVALAWSGTSASTPALVAKVRRAETGLGALPELAIDFADQFNSGDARGVIAAAGRYGKALRTLGEQAGVPLLVPALARYMAIAEQHGGAAKPSGAGGGDLGIAFFLSVEAAAAAQREAVASGLVACDLGWDHGGAQRATPGWA